ncbi:MAG: hypothetical protein HYT93_01260 [Parcubacteria group bacterium]|nr:hypothetical protein [Parcubacteria group bacterium]
MEWFWNFVISTPEYQHFGWNLISGSFLITVGLTFGLQLPGLTNQAKTIWKNQSAGGIEMLTFIAFFTYFVVFLVYAFSIHSGAGIVNALVLLPPQLFILMGVARFKKLRKIDMFVAVVGIALFLCAVILSHKEIFFLIASVAVFIGLTLQPLEMVKTKTSANVALSFPFNFAIVAVVWAIYGAAIHDWFLAGASGSFAIVYLFTVILWFKYRPKHIKLV